MIRWSAMLGALEALENGTTAIVDHHESPERDRGQPRRHRRGLRRGRRPLGPRLRDHRPPRTRRRPARPRRERALPPRRRPRPRRHPRRVHLLGRVAARRPPAWPRTSASASTSTSARASATSTRRAGSAGLTRDDWLLAHCVHLPTDHALRGTILHNPMSNLNNAVGYANPARFANPVALGTDGIGGNVLEAFRLAYVLQRSVDVTCGPGHGLVAGSRPAGTWCRRRATTRSPGRTTRWTPGTSPSRPGSGRCEVTVGGEVVLADGRPTRVDADEIRAKAREQAARLHARL